MNRWAGSSPLPVHGREQQLPRIEKVAQPPGVALLRSAATAHAKRPKKKKKSRRPALDTPQPFMNRVRYVDQRAFSFPVREAKGHRRASPCFAPSSGPGAGRICPAAVARSARAWYRYLRWCAEASAGTLGNGEP